MLLDQDWGFHPHTTWSRTTAINALETLSAAGVPRAAVITLGVLRAFHTRHGAGPFPTGDAGLTAAIREPDNPTNAWQGEFRAGWFDLPLARYALHASRRAGAEVDALALTWLDQWAQLPERKVCIGYGEADLMHALQTENEGISAPSIERQEEIGRGLARCRPIYTDAPEDPGGYARRLADWLHLPIGLLSYGPTAGEKYR